MSDILKPIHDNHFTETRMNVSLTDPRVILAGIKQFGLAPDGSDLRDLEAAIDRLCASPADAAQGEVVAWCWRRKNSNGWIVQVNKPNFGTPELFDCEPLSPPPAPAWRTMERIQQRGPNDCGIAALAMACGVSYESVAPLLESSSGAGVNEPDLYEWLKANGWAWQMVYQNYRRAGEYHRRTPWPPTPFAPSHIVQVRASQEWHFTVMDGIGRVFDPWTADRKTLHHPDYREISWVMGLWKVAPPGAPASYEMEKSADD